MGTQDNPPIHSHLLTEGALDPSLAVTELPRLLSDHGHRPHKAPLLKQFLLLVLFFPPDGHHTLEP